MTMFGKKKDAAAPEVALTPDERLQRQREIIAQIGRLENEMPRLQANVTAVKEQAARAADRAAEDKRQWGEAQAAADVANRSINRLRGELTVLSKGSAIDEFQSWCEAERVETVRGIASIEAPFGRNLITGQRPRGEAYTGVKVRGLNTNVGSPSIRVAALAEASRKAEDLRSQAIDDEALALRLGALEAGIPPLVDEWEEYAIPKPEILPSLRRA
jgi:hypothetical protein